jgi:GntR family transcriptional repressor for pyruvate dehydrogenase complex
MNAAPVRVERHGGLGDDLVRALERRIRIGALRPGERLPTERQLGVSVGVSRAVVREALARLKADGFVESRQGSGAFVSARPGHASFRLVAPPYRARQDLRQIFELRRITEVAAAELAARRRTPTDLRAMRTEVARMAAALAAGVDGSLADAAFHRAIAAATHNPYIRQFIEFLGGPFAATRRPSWTPAGLAAGLAARAQREHEAIVRAIASGRSAAARQAAETHLRNSARRAGLEPSRPARRGRKPRR